MCLGLEGENGLESFRGLRPDKGSIWQVLAPYDLDGLDVVDRKWMKNMCIYTVYIYILYIYFPVVIS